MIKQMGWIEQTCDDQRKPTDVKDTLVTDEYIASEITVPFVRYIYTGRSIYKCQPWQNVRMLPPTKLLHSSVKTWKWLNWFMISLIVSLGQWISRLGIPRHSWIHCLSIVGDMNPSLEIVLLVWIVSRTILMLDSCVVKPFEVDLFMFHASWRSDFFQWVIFPASIVCLSSRRCCHWTAYWESNQV